MTRFVTPTVLTLTLAAILAGPADAQQRDAELGVTAPAARPTPELGLEPTQPPEQQGAGTREQDFYPGPVRSGHEPVFVKPFVTTVRVSRSSGVRLGLSGWTAPAVPFDMRESSGGVAFGFTLLWDVPLPPPTPGETGTTGER